MSNEQRDYSLLRPFDLEAAKRGEAVCWAKDGEVMRFVGESMAYGGGCFEFLEGAYKGKFETYRPEKIRMAPLAWVRVSADDPTLRPVYRGDVLYNPLGATVRRVVVRCDRDGEVLCDDGKHDKLDALTCAPPKVKREGWVCVVKRKDTSTCFMGEIPDVFVRNTGIFPTKEAAQAWADRCKDVIDISPVSWEEPATITNKE